MKLSDRAKEMVEIVRTACHGRLDPVKIRGFMAIKARRYDLLVMELRKAGLLEVDCRVGGGWQLKSEVMLKGVKQ